MKYGALVLGILLISSHMAYAEDDTITRDQTWRICQRSSDCVVAEALCPGTYWPIHHRYLWDNARINERMHKVITCTPTNMTPPAEAYCLGGVCVLRK
jgi:hypothetical protein